MTHRRKIDNSGLGQGWGNARSRPYLVQPVGDRVEVVLDEIRVDVQGHRCRRMPEHPLHGLHVGAGTHAQRRCCVPEFMRSESVLADRSGGRGEPAAARVPVTQRRSGRRGEHQGIRWPAGDVYGRQSPTNASRNMRGRGRRGDQGRHARPAARPGQGEVRTTSRGCAWYIDTFGRVARQPTIPHGQRHNRGQHWSS